MSENRRTGELQLQFRDENFLRKNVLDARTVLEYFYLSPFFDAASLNQRRRRGLPVANEEAGIEYRLTFSHSPQDVAGLELGSSAANSFGVFVIQKFFRPAGKSGAPGATAGTPLECYYVLGGTIQRSPVLASLLRQRVVTAVAHLQHILDSAEALHAWSLLDGFVWKPEVAVTPPSASLPAGEEAVAAGGIATLAASPGISRSPRISRSPYDVKQYASERLFEAATGGTADAKDRSAEAAFAHFAEDRYADGRTPVVGSPHGWEGISKGLHAAAGTGGDMDSFGKPPCSAVDAVISEIFERLTSSATTFNAQVTGIRQQWAAEDAAWNEANQKGLETLAI